jgi:UDP-N-acetylglucosamine 1-carboxyvinyltransferase
MSKLIIQGGVSLEGHVDLAGAKNAALPILVASLLTEEKCILHNVPDIADVRIMLEIMTALGAGVAWHGDTLHVDGSSLSRWEVPRELGSKIRYSLLLLGLLLARFGRAKVPAPGGCRLGERKFDLHLMGFERMGAQITLEDGFICAETRGLHGAALDLYFPTKSGTDNIILAACRARGSTIIRNPCRYPETADLAEFLRKMGAQIEGAGSEVIRIEGVSTLRGASHDIMSDRIEAATFMVAAAATNGRVTMPGAVGRHLVLTMEALRQAGVRFQEVGNSVLISAEGGLRPVDVTGGPDPMINTDILPLLTVVAILAEGESRFTDLSFEDRYRYGVELVKMGADFRIEGADFRFPGGQPGQRAVVRGPRKLQGAPVRALDLRGGAALVLAGLAAEGTTVISNVAEIDRGYVNLEGKLARLGARIQRQNCP